MSVAELNDTERSIIKNMMLTRSHNDIAKFLDREKSLIALLITELINGTSIATYQMTLDAKPKLKRVVVANTRKEDEKRKRDYEKEQKRLRQEIEHENSTNRRRRNDEPIFKTKLVDYSKKILVRIDHRTCVYVNPGTDINELKKKYFDRINKVK